jgi:anti-sigma regulatory factor (Ser/Thr protein kinase)
MLFGFSETTASHADVRVLRTAPDLWWLCVDAAVTDTDVVASLPTGALPSAALTQVVEGMSANGSATTGDRTAVVAKVELDVCGAWVTMANAGPARPVVVRRAGWVDVRGHPSASLGDPDGYEAADDRVGLGPGDVLVVRRDSADPNEPNEFDLVLDAALAHAGGTPTAIANAVAAAAAHNGSGPIVALGVPHDLGADPRQRVAQATGLPIDELASPGYPLADLQPDLWKEPPRPPRLARLRLTEDRQTVSAVRSLLDRLLASWRLFGRIADDDVKLIATELAANAVVHSREPNAVTVRYLGDLVRVEVTDQSSVLPQPREPDVEGVGGRGLQLVEALGSAWGTERLEHGKRVWCEVAVAVV